MLQVIRGLSTFFIQILLVLGPFSFAAGNEWDNGYTEAEFHRVLQNIESHYRPLAEAAGGTFQIDHDWTDGAANAFAWRIGDEFILEVPGGIARYHLITEDAFILILCHELGHLFGGDPHSHNISFEGQSDYYSTNICFRKLRPEATIDQTLAGALALTSFYAKISKVSPPRLETPDPTQVNKTLRSHPSPQCRLDTLVAGLFSQPRPRCWYRD